MRLSYPLLTGFALVAWAAGRLLAPAIHSSGEAPPAFAIPGSAYGSLMARMMRDTLYTYWHSGESTRTHQQVAKNQAAAPQAPPPPPAAGRFARRGQPQPLPQSSPAQVVEAPQFSGSWLDRGSQLIAHLEASRTRRQGPLVMSAAHRRYIEAAADWRLRLAVHLDPGDAVLYEILHYQFQTKGGDPAEVRKASEQLAQQAVARGLSEAGGLSDALTGAGAAINLLNYRLQPGQTDPATTAQAWTSLDACMTKYHRLRAQAQREGWWNGIPELRREELEHHAKFLEKLTGRIKSQLAQKGILTQAGSH